MGYGVKRWFLNWSGRLRFANVGPGVIDHTLTDAPPEIGAARWERRVAEQMRMDGSSRLAAVEALYQGRQQRAGDVSKVMRILEVSADDARWLLRNSANVKEAVLNGSMQLKAGLLSRTCEVRAVTQDAEIRDESTVHPLFRDTAQGFALRKALVDGLPPSQQVLLEDSVPVRCRHLLQEYQRKVAAACGRELQENDYANKGVKQSISAEQWDKFWASAAPNKATDANFLHHNLFKALRKRLKEDEDRPDKELRITHKVFDAFRRLLNVGLATLHIFTAWEPEVLRSSMWHFRLLE